jgi:hypothetical protein
MLHSHLGVCFAVVGTERGVCRHGVGAFRGSLSIAWFRRLVESTFGLTDHRQDVRLNTIRD